MTYSIAENIQRMQQHVAELAKQYQRTPKDIQLLGVSKTKPAALIKQAYDAGLTAFGENYLQEALEKITILNDLPIEWHFIGHIQTNKTKAIAEHFTWVHSVDSLKIAERLNKQRPAELSPLNICLQINIDQETNKQGILLNNIHTLAKAIIQLPRLRLRGLMAIPKPRQSFNEQRQPYQTIYNALQQLKNDFANCDYLDTLSMGMSNDLAAAIAEGATIVRIGTAIFGARTT